MATSTAPLIVESPYFNKAPPRWFKGYRNWKRRDDLAKIKTVLVHQAATHIGVSKQLLAKHHGNLLEARIERLHGTSLRRRGVPYHGLFSPEDLASIQLWHPKRTTWHGHGGNKDSVGWCCIGKFPGDDVHPELGAHFGAMLDSWAEMGLELKYIEAHRQHSDQRGGDPGAELWETLVDAAAARGIVTRPEHRTGSGRPIPDWWLSH